MNGTLFLFGSCWVQTSAAYRTALLNLCLRCEISYTGFRHEADGTVGFRTSYGAARRLQRLCKAEGIVLQISEKRGLPFLFWRYRKRAGLWLGGLLAIALLVLSGQFVWDIRITGNETMTESAIREELKACGLYPGSYIPRIHTGELENRVLISSDRISWISVYLDGTVATVQIIEHTPTPVPEDLSKPANLIAAADGQIETVELFRGNCVVKTGQAVRKGELLVSGLYDSSVTGYRYTRAAGNVYARTERSFTVEIPLVSEEKVYQGAYCRSIYLNFFDFSVNIFKNTGNEAGIYDIIREEKGLDIIGLGGVPIGLSVERGIPYALESVTRTPEQALELGYAELERSLGSLSEEISLLSKSVKTTLTDSSLILECSVTCLENIAMQSEFEISEQP